MVQFFLQLPSTSQTAIIASFVTLLGMLFAAVAAFIASSITNRSHEERLQKKLDHDCEQRRVEREMALRKEVYLGAVEAIIAGIGVIARCVDLGVPSNELGKELSKRQSSIAKVHLIGREETIRALFTFATELSAAILHLFLLRQPLIDLQMKICSVDALIGMFSKEKDRLVEAMKQCNYAGDTSQQRWNFLQQTFDFEKNRQEKAMQERTALAEQLQKGNLMLAKEAYSLSNKINKLLPPVVKTVREEIGMPLNEQEYAGMWSENLRRMDEVMNNFFVALEKKPEQTVAS